MSNGIHLWGLGALWLLASCAAVPTDSGPALEWPDARKLIAEDGSAWHRATPQMRIRAARAIEERLDDFRFLRIETFASGESEHEVALFLHEPTGMEFSLVPGGAPAGDADRAVTGFLIARTEVPQSVWRAELGNNPSSRRDADRPVERVSWTDAIGFCRRLDLALPTSDQWEVACRAGTSTRFSFGDDVDLLPEHAWFAADSDGAARPVARLAPNAFGLYDVHGNVREWCKDRVGGYGIDEGRSVALRVIRGGAWDYPAEILGSAVRNWGTPDTRSANIGFRPVRSLAGR